MGKTRYGWVTWWGKSLTSRQRCRKKLASCYLVLSHPWSSCYLGWFRRAPLFGRGVGYHVFLLWYFFPEFGVRLVLSLRIYRVGKFLILSLSAFLVRIGEQAKRYMQGFEITSVTMLREQPKISKCIHDFLKSILCLLLLTAVMSEELFSTRILNYRE